MNNSAREQIQTLKAQIEGFKQSEPMVEASEAFAKYRETCNKAVSVLEELQGQLEQLRDGEQTKYDNLPEGLQKSENGQKMEAAIERLEEAISRIDDMAGQLNDETQLVDEDDIDTFITEATEALDGAL